MTNILKTFRVKDRFGDIRYNDMPISYEATAQLIDNTSITIERFGNRTYRMMHEPDTYFYTTGAMALAIRDCVESRFPYTIPDVSIHIRRKDSDIYPHFFWNDNFIRIDNENEELNYRISNRDGDVTDERFLSIYGVLKQYKPFLIACLTHYAKLDVKSDKKELTCSLLELNTTLKSLNDIWSLSADVFWIGYPHGFIDMLSSNLVCAPNIREESLHI